jgi:hypothetical protein
MHGAFGSAVPSGEREAERFALSTVGKQAYSAGIFSRHIQRCRRVFPTNAETRLDGINLNPQGGASFVSSTHLASR